MCPTQCRHQRHHVRGPQMLPISYRTHVPVQDLETISKDIPLACLIIFPFKASISRRASKCPPARFPPRYKSSFPPAMEDVTCFVDIDAEGRGPSFRGPGFCFVSFSLPVPTPQVRTFPVPNPQPFHAAFLSERTKVACDVGSLVCNPLPVSFDSTAFLLDVLVFRQTTP
ncbi:hypothetical protein DPEC_G00176240 [Dallia pectoralis]|uniref:Uncharacterized protein n=1 Tax=Dallia pectoralis TaxID=75939 RepID=A0ACC2GF67_DALPE|nr:hypothetical protein DPEC_G00176240 [Dallia pectoralis]